MQAVAYGSYGGGAAALKHVKVPIPDLKKDELLLKVEAVSLNPIDWKVQKGILRPFFPLKFPHIPCTDVSGEVIKVGSDVKDFEPGDKVVSAINLAIGGGLAEYAVVNAGLTVPRPARVSAADAASLSVAGITAYQAITRVGRLALDGTASPGKNILITAASGGVGHLAVQLAKLARNTHVTATCGARNIGFVKRLGADEVLDYKTPEGASLKSPSGKKYDLVINCASGISWSTFESNLSTKGKVIYLNPAASVLRTILVQKITFSKKKAVLFFAAKKREDLGFLVELIEEGKLRIRIDSKYPLSKAEDAWATCMGGHATGKIIVQP